MTSGLRKLVFFVLLVGVAYAAYLFMIKPANKGLVVKKAEVQTKEGKLEEFKGATQALDDLTQQLEELEGAIEFFESKLPPTSEIDKVLRDVTDISEKQGLKPKTIRMLQEKDNSGYVEQPIKMEFVGTFSSFYSFLLELEKLPRITKIRELKIRKQKEGQISTNFVVSIFFEGKTHS
jgi:Tfp pilus assembly protein PilO